jgi:hypothetical protein
MARCDRRPPSNAPLASLKAYVTGPENWIPRSGHSVGYPAWGSNYYMILSAATSDRRSDISSGAPTRGRPQASWRRPWRMPACTGRSYLRGSMRRTTPKATRNIGLVSLDGRVELLRKHSKQERPDIPEKSAVAFLETAPLTSNALSGSGLVYLRLHQWRTGPVSRHVSHRRAGPAACGAFRSTHERFGGQVVKFRSCSWCMPGLGVWRRRGSNKRESSVSARASGGPQSVLGGGNDRHRYHALYS